MILIAGVLALACIVRSLTMTNKHALDFYMDELNASSQAFTVEPEAEAAEAELVMSIHPQGSPAAPVASSLDACDMSSC